MYVLEQNMRNVKVLFAEFVNGTFCFAEGVSQADIFVCQFGAVRED